MEKILSVIVPVYNVERFLPRCLDSLLRQGMNEGGENADADYEIICVDDGSTDGCPAILADYAQRHPHLFRVIRQENQGLGGARNTATAVAQGEYVTYVDSDDYLIDGAYAYLCQHFLGSKPDVIAYDHRNVYTDGVTPFDATAKPEGKILFEGDGAEAYNRLPLPNVWSKFYRRAFLLAHGIQSEITICQDELFNFEVFRHHPRTIVLDSKLYCYERENGDSIQNTRNEAKVLAQLDELLFLNAPLMEKYLHEGNEEMKPAALRNINNFLNIYYKKVLQVLLPWKKWRRNKKRLEVLPAYTYPFETTNKMEHRLTALKHLSGQSYLVYLLLYLFNRYLLKKYLACANRA
ncbi:MAG: glycosyltransferase [Bacteroidaceae bacterium]|nr:glycosyltransferase [Bacteroidaceae bacterium]